MKRVIVRYKVKADRAAENVAYVKNVFAELASSAPDGLRYATFQAEDGVSFTHVASIETTDGSNPLAATVAFKQFQAEIKDRCETPPAATTVDLVGSYRFMDCLFARRVTIERGDEARGGAVDPLSHRLYYDMV